MTASYQQYFHDKVLLSKLEELHNKKYQLKELLEKEESSPYIVEFSGLPRTGKSSSVDRVYEFFKKASFSVVKTKEPAQIIKDTMTKDELSKMSNLDFNNLTLKIAKEELEKTKQQNPILILEDRGVIDNYFWYQMMYEEGTIDEVLYRTLLMDLKEELKELDQLYLLTADSSIIVERDYQNQIYLEERKKTNKKRVEELNLGYQHLSYFIKEEVDKEKYIPIDTSYISGMKTSIIIADTIMDGMKKKVLKKKKENH